MQIRVFATLRQLTGQSVVEVQAGPGKTIRLALEQLVAQHPVLKDKVWDAQGGLSSTVNVLYLLNNSGEGDRHLQNKP